ncbi:beta-lactamase family protein [Candidatus Poribacteria bacterium]|nr:beta-lactamase family protein [Candidatus Poribacteria bacterium]MBT5534932.1 beta-lactamase family protein [Candidatus Poribacteria bacterium]MBT7808882.1 beta-lactamase family protein [Candidatus Poribacteria bacterium]
MRTHAIASPKYRWATGLLIALSLGSSVALAQTLMPAEYAVQLQQALDEAYDKFRMEDAGMVAVIHPQYGFWEGVSGNARRDPNEEMRLEHLGRIASISKTFAAATILSMSDEGTLNLEDSVEQWLPGLAPNGENITVRHLLGHRSGLDSFTDWINLNAEPARVWDPAEVAELSVRRPVHFQPGERYSYCNTGFVLLGLIVEAAGETYEVEIRNRFLDPLGLSDTYMDGRDAVPDLIADPPTAPKPYTSWATAAWTAGGMVSSAGDLARWAAALYGGEVLSAESTDELLTPFEGDAYSLGTMHSTTKRGKTVGHEGSIPGFTASMHYYPESGLSTAGIASGGGGGALRDMVLRAMGRIPALSVGPAAKLATTWGAVKADLSAGR